MAAHPAPAWTGWAAFAGIGAVGYCLADRRRPLWWILLAVQVVQFCLHVWFSCSTPASGGPASVHSEMAMHGGMHQVMPMSQVSHDSGMSLGMFCAHVLAGVVVAVWLHAGERALWRALSSIVGLLVRRTLRSFVWSMHCGTAMEDRRPTGAFHRAACDQTAPEYVTLRHAVVRRGPPCAADIHAYCA